MVILLVFSIVVLKLTGQPVVMGISSMGKVFPFISPLPFGLFANLHTLQFFGIGEVDIEVRSTAASLFQNLAGNLADILSRRLKIGVRHVVAQ